MTAFLLRKAFNVEMLHKEEFFLLLHAETITGQVSILDIFNI